VRELPADQGPGTILLLKAEYEHVTEIVSGFGKLGVSAERLASTAAHRMAGYLESDAFAGPYLADQLCCRLRWLVAAALRPSSRASTAGRRRISSGYFSARRLSFEQLATGTHLITIA
jgi:RNA 3'-terminal phosphate cyclase (ATP)